MALGKGLSAILKDVEEAYDTEFGKNLVKEINLELIKPNPYQPRKRFDEESLSELSQSIDKHGLIQPIIVIKNGDGYTLIAGERRFRATKMLGKSTIKAIIANLDDQNLRELAIIENIQRENLNPIELANSYKELINDYGITQEALGSLIKKSRTQITNTLRLLNLDESTQKLLQDGKITQGHAKVMVGLDVEDEKMVAKTVIGQRLNVHDTENLVKKIKKSNNLNNKNLLNDSEFSKKIDILINKFSGFGFSCQTSKNGVLIKFSDVLQIDKLISRLDRLSKV